MQNETPPAADLSIRPDVAVRGSTFAGERHPPQSRHEPKKMAVLPFLLEFSQFLGRDPQIGVRQGRSGGMYWMAAGGGSGRAPGRRLRFRPFLGLYRYREKVFARKAFVRILGREAQSAELKPLVQALKLGTSSRSEVMLQLRHSAEGELAAELGMCELQGLSALRLWMKAKSLLSKGVRRC